MLGDRERIAVAARVDSSNSGLHQIARFTSPGDGWFSYHRAAEGFPGYSGGGHCDDAPLPRGAEELLGAGYGEPEPRPWTEAVSDRGVRFCGYAGRCGV